MDYSDYQQKVKQLANNTDEVSALFFDEDNVVLEEYGDRLIHDLEEIILLSTELRVRYKIDTALSEEKKIKL